MLLNVLMQNFLEPRPKKNYIHVLRRMSQVIQVFFYLLMEGSSKTLKSIESIPEHSMLLLLKIMYLQQLLAPHAQYLMAIGPFLNHYHQGNTIAISENY